MFSARLRAGSRIALKVIAWLLSLAALGFFANRLSNAGLPAGWYRDPALIGATLAGTLLYAVSVGMLAIAWNLLLQAPLNRCDLSIYLISQFAKYIPGNVLQFAGRHVLGRQSGHDHGPLAAAAAFEIGSLLGVSCGLLLLLGQPTLQQVLPWWRPLPAAIGFLFLLALPIVLLVLHALPWTRWPRPVPTSRGLVAALLHIGFFLIFSLLFLLLCGAVGEAGVRFWQATGGVATGWLGGFVIPGAPAGVGLREAIILISVTGTVPQSDRLLIAIALLRITTLGGDFIAYLGGLVVRGTRVPH
jgi:hypothetical protein